MDLDIRRTWLVSDSHFGHKNIIGFCHRPEDVEQIMMEEWASVIGEGDSVIHLGDLCYRGNSWFKNMIAPHLTGDKRLILGNHDKQRYGFYKKCGFKITKPFEFHVVDNSGFGVELVDHPRKDSWTISLSHYPANEVLGDREVRIHGHIHNNGYTRSAYVPFIKNHINISVEQTKYKPLNLKLLLDGYLLGKFPEGDADPSGEIEGDSITSKKEQTYQ